MVDVGCDPGTRWEGIGGAVAALTGRGLRVSVDTFDPVEAAAAADAGAELVLSVNASNRVAAAGWGVEVVVVPDVPGTLQGLGETVGFLRDRGVRCRLDPVLDPIGFGFAASLARYLEARARFPDVPVLMGVGNLTELTDVDSAGVNTLLLGFCQEVGVTSVLTTEVINWSRSSVPRSWTCARRPLMYHAVHGRTLPKHVEPRLVRAPRPEGPTFRPPTCSARWPALRSRMRTGGCTPRTAGSAPSTAPDSSPTATPSELFDRMEVADPAHAFYLGYELAKARTALPPFTKRIARTRPSVGGS